MHLHYLNRCVILLWGGWLRQFYFSRELEWSEDLDIFWCGHPPILLIIMYICQPLLVCFSSYLFHVECLSLAGRTKIGDFWKSWFLWRSLCSALLNIQLATALSTGIVFITDFSFLILLLPFIFVYITLYNFIFFPCCANYCFYCFILSSFT